MTDALAVLAHYFPQPTVVRRIEPLGNAGGWSGSRLWRVSPVANEGDLCLRRWPQEHPSPERLRFIHATLDTAAATLTFVPAPLRTAQGESFVEQSGHLWELTRWMPGAADQGHPPPKPRLAAGFRALARFHDAVAGAATRGRAPAFAERLFRVDELQGGQLAELSAAVHQGREPQLDKRARRLLALAPPRLAALVRPLEAACPREGSLLPVIRDIHRDHVLFAGDEVTGLIDFGAMRFDTPLADVARLLGSLAEDDAPSRQAALDGYAALRPIPSADAPLIDLLDRCTVILGGLNWLTWLYLERRDLGPLPPIIERLDGILARLTGSEVSVTRFGHG